MDRRADRRDERRPTGRTGGRIPPHNLQAEESVIGALLLSREAIGAVTEQGLRPDDFYRPGHQHLFDAIRALYATGAPADTITVADELRRAGLLEQVGGVEALHELQNATPAISNAAHYARIVQDTAMLRRLIHVAADIAELAYGEPDDVTKAVDEAESRVFKVAEERVADSTQLLSESIKGVMDRLEETFARGDIITGTATGYHDIDELLSGLQPSTLNIVGARPAMGKCVAADTPMVDLTTGEVVSARELVERATARGHVTVRALDPRGRQCDADVSACVEDGVKPVFKVRTRSGRSVTITATHPLLTVNGWRPLSDLSVGVDIAVPTSLPVFGTEDLPDAEIDLVALLLGDGSVSHSKCSPSLTTASAEVLASARAAAEAFGVSLVDAGTTGRARTWRLSAGYTGGRANPVTVMLRRHGLWGCTAHSKRIPAAVFRLPRARLARFINRLFATDGTAWVSSAGYARIGYASVSEQLVMDVVHLLLRFGIRTKLRRRDVLYRGARRRAFEVEVMDAPSLRRFADDIGIIGRSTALGLVRAVADPSAFGFSIDSVPAEVWDDVIKAKGELSWAEINRRCGRLARHNWHAHRGRVRRETVARLADVLDDDQLRWWASPDIAWDRIVEIAPAGDAEVVDFTVPGLHNFVAADIYLHNTAFGLGMATHVAQTTGRPVLVFSLEMGHNELTQRILASEAKVDSMKMRNGRLTEADWAKIGRAIGRLEVPLFLDDNPRVTVMEIRAKARRMKARHGGLALIVVDYLQLMSGGGNPENRQLEVSEISRNLKILARELEVPIVALSQLSRNLESRGDKRPMLQDLRESGCLTADARLVRADTNVEVRLGDLVADGVSDVPVWSLDEHYRLVPARLVRAFASGVKPTFRLRLASGRTIEASANHPFLTLSGWCPLERLEVGDHLATARRVPTVVGTEPVATSSQQLANDVQSLLLRLDVRARLRTGAHRRGRVGFYVDVSGRDDQLRFAEEIGVHGARGRILERLVTTLMERSSDTNVDVVPAGVWEHVRHKSLGDSKMTTRQLAATLGMQYCGSTLYKSGVSRYRLRRVAEATGDPGLHDLATSDVLWDRIVDVSPLGPQAVFDATIDETHNFVANGLIAHNSLEQDADVVMFLYRDEVYNAESPDKGSAEVIIAKHRSGPIGTKRLVFLGQYTRFDNAARGV